MNKEERREYMKAYYQAHKQEHLKRCKAYYQAHKEVHLKRCKAYKKAHREQVNAKKKAWYQAHKQEHLKRCKAYKESHKEEIKLKKKAWQEAHKEHYREYMKAYIKSDVNSKGQTKHSIRMKSMQILKKMNLHISGYEIHHCFGYEDPSKFIYISKSLHLKIHQFLRDNNIDADSDHWMAIREMVNSTDEFMYIKC